MFITRYATARHGPQRLRRVPFVTTLFGQVDRAFEVTSGFFQITAQDAKFPERIEGHRDLLVPVVYLGDKREGTIERLVSTIPLSYEHQIESKIVVSDSGHHLMVGMLVVFNCLF